MTKNVRRLVSGLYIIVFPNESVYVGGSLHSLYQRVQNQLKALWDGVHPNKRLQVAFCECGGHGLLVSMQELQVQSEEDLAAAETAEIAFQVSKRGRDKVLNGVLEARPGDYSAAAANARNAERRAAADARTR